MRIALDGRYIRDDFPGIGRYVYNLARALPAIAPDVEFVLLHNPEAPNTRYDFGALSQPNLTLVPTDIPIRSITEQIRLPRLARWLSLDAFHAPYYITAYRMPCRHVVTIYDVISARYPEYLPSPAMRLIFEVTTRLALRTADRILTLSKASRQDLVKLYHVDPHRISVTPLAAGPHFKPANRATIEELRRRRGLPDRYVLYVGSNKPHKNLPRLVEAFAHIPHPTSHIPHPTSRIPHPTSHIPHPTSHIPHPTSHIPHPASRIPLVIAGHEDPRYPQARERAAALGLDSVMFLGAVVEEDLPALYSGAELFVFPSLYEGFGLPVIEAMACGTPVACSNVSSLPEVAGDAALLFDPHTPELIAAAIRQALQDEDLRERLRRRGLKQAGHFSWEHTARLTLEAYRQA